MTAAGYYVTIESSAAKTLIKINRADQRRISEKIKALGADPRPNGCVKLTGAEDAYRIRVGEYRVVYLIEDAIRVITITRIGHRRDIYERM